MPPVADAPRRVALLGAGLIGGSVGLALRRAGAFVSGYDRDPARVEHARELGVFDEAATSVAQAVKGADLVVVAVPVGQVADVVVEALDAGATLVTDVGSVKSPVVVAVERARPDLAPRFVGGHPMAGSEQEGLDGASADLFVGATWVLTPTGRTDPQAFATVRAWVVELGAEALAVTPELHDALVAVVSHVPQLAASTLMNVANAGRRRARRAAAPRRRRLPRHDPHRVEPSGDLARHLRRQPRRDRRRARRLPRRPSEDSRAGRRR